MIPEIILGMVLMCVLLSAGSALRNADPSDRPYYVFCVPYILMDGKSKTGRNGSVPWKKRPVDLGASGTWRAFWDITLPLIMPAVIVRIPSGICHVYG